MKIQGPQVTSGNCTGRCRVVWGPLRPKTTKTKDWKPVEVVGSY